MLHIIAETSSREWLEYLTSPAFSSTLFAELLEFESVGTWEDWTRKRMNDNTADVIMYEKLKKINNVEIRNIEW